MEELRSEMLEMRDMYMEDDVYQLQELRQQLEQVGAGGRPGASAATCTSCPRLAEGKRFATEHWAINHVFEHAAQCDARNVIDLFDVTFQTNGECF